ncbi:hypothetical protein HMPREF1981_00822 [Bacteroides pyogenes F0041]|uniref:Uncharacterized protein n=1 Tax=Bacteroides pyogenes F0041 TaxID=1321819 RepID=U2E2Q7_9BACE|nr:hypothetical protein HMPREF1981_00822 [Bacteroides pyogenes F0041]
MALFLVPKNFIIHIPSPANGLPALMNADGIITMRPRQNDIPHHMQT